MSQRNYDLQDYNKKPIKKNRVYGTMTVISNAGKIICILVFIIIILSMNYIKDYNYNYIDADGKYIEVDADFLIQCDSKFDSKCNDVPIHILEEFVMTECDESNTNGWNNCEISFEVDNELLDMIWIVDDDLTCKYKIKKCNESNYCEVNMHSWTDGTTSLTWYDTPINKIEFIENSWNLETWQAVNDYNNGRGMLYSQILNCYN